MTLVALDLSTARFENGRYFPSPAAKFEDAVRCLNDSDRGALRKASGVAFAKKAGFEAVLGALVVGLLSDKIDRQNVGILFCGTQAHVVTAHEFALRAIKRGTTLIDPLQFPATLPSYAPTAIAATHRCHGPALTVGHGAKSHRAAANIARSYLQAKVISQAILVLTSADQVTTSWTKAYALAKLVHNDALECQDFFNEVSKTIDYAQPKRQD